MAYRSRRVLVSFRPNPFLRKLRGEVPEKFQAPSAGWSWGSVSSTDHEGRQFWIAAAEREDTGRFIVRALDKLAAFMGLEAAIGAWAAIALDEQVRFIKSRAG